MGNEIWIVSAKRTPIGRFQGLLQPYPAPQLGAFAIRAAMKSLGENVLSETVIDEVLMGCVLPAGCGQAPARQAALGAGLPLSTGCTTINKVCGSGMKSIMLAHDLIKAGTIRTAVAGGMESMTNAPYLLKEARNGMRLGHHSTYDHMFLDGLQDAYEGHLMGVYAQKIADRLKFSREKMDEWATMSAKRALEAQERGLFDDEIAPIDIRTKTATTHLDYDEHPRSIDLEKIPQLKPAFDKKRLSDCGELQCHFRWCSRVDFDG